MAVEIFGDSVGAAIIGLGGRILHVRRVTRPRGYRSPQDVARDLADIARPLLHEVGQGRVFGIAVAVAALVRDRDGVVTTAPRTRTSRSWVPPSSRSDRSSPIRP